MTSAGPIPDLPFLDNDKASQGLPPSVHPAAVDTPVEATSTATAVAPSNTGAGSGRWQRHLQDPSCKAAVEPGACMCGRGCLPNRTCAPSYLSLSLTHTHGLQVPLDHWGPDVFCPNVPDSTAALPVVSAHFHTHPPCFATLPVLQGPPLLLRRALLRQALPAAVRPEPTCGTCGTQASSRQTVPNLCRAHASPSSTPLLKSPR